MSSTVMPVTLSPTTRRLPFSRDQLMLLMIAINEFFLGLDTFLAHSISGTIVPREWIPIIFGPLASLLLLIAGLIALRRRPLASIIATLTLLASIGVGLLGSYYHLIRAALPNAPWEQRITIDLLVWAPPIMGPMAFALVGWLGISAAWVEDPPDSGRLILPGGYALQLPYSKTHAYFFVVSLGTLTAVISAALDHARLHYTNPWLWVPIVVGVFATVVAAGMGTIDQPTRLDRMTYIAAMLLLIVTGPIGSALHIQANLTSQGAIVIERFIRGAPFLAPLLFTNMGILGLIALLDPVERVPRPARGSHGTAGKNL